MKRRTLQIHWLALLIGVVALMFSSALEAQFKSAGGVKLPKYYDKPNQNQLKFLLTGGQSTNVGGGKILIWPAKIETFARTGERQTISEARECYYDAVKEEANSAGPLKMQTADGKLFVQGEGYLLQQSHWTNFSIFLSNKVETTIHKQLMAAQTSRVVGGDLAATNSPVESSAPDVKTIAGADTNQFVKIYSRQAYGFFNSSSNVVVCSNEVRAVDQQMELTCALATAHFDTNGAVQEIVAETNVVIVGKQDQSRATGDQAVYILNAKRETMELLGNPHWQDAQREVKADRFLFDRRANSMRAEPNAYLKLPRSVMAQAGPLAVKSPTTPIAPVPTNEFIEITSQVLTMLLPTTNRPGRIMTAETNVVIFNPGDQSRATCDQAIYTEANGVLTLNGRAVWRSLQRELRGDILIFERTNQVFSAQGNAYLKLPVTVLEKSGSGSPTSTVSTNQFIEIFSDSSEYRDNVLSFNESVRANLLRGDEMTGWLTSDEAKVQLTNNQISRIVARGKVAAGLVPSAETVRKIYKQLNGEILTLNFGTNGQVESFMAEQEVVGRQDEIRSGTNDIHTRLTTDMVRGSFFPHTNELERMEADGNVFVEQGDLSAHGDQAVYTAANHLLVLTGNPGTKLPQGEITDCEMVIWDVANNKVSWRGVGRGGHHKSFWYTGPQVTNQSNLRFSK